jgi:myo-inositol-1(or 4)-monophosphatase
MTDLDAALAAALDAVQLAGRAVMPDFGRASGVRLKGPGQPVTDADFRADRILRERLRAFDPAAGWLSEETADSPDRLTRRRVWVVDPIDGTQRFLDGIPEFGISVALVEAGEAVLGVVHNPASGECYHALCGGGAYRDGTRIAVPAPRPGGDRGRLLVSADELHAGELDGLDPLLERLVVGSTSIKLARVAAGDGAAYLSRRGKGEWDVCAGALIVAEAGGWATDAAGRRFVYNRPVPLVNGVLAGTVRAHARILAELRAAPGGSGPNR